MKRSILVLFFVLGMRANIVDAQVPISPSVSPTPAMKADSRIAEIGPPDELITEGFVSVPITQVEEGIIENARVAYQVNTTRVRSIKFIEDTPILGAQSHQEAVEIFLKANHQVVGLASDLSNLRLTKTFGQNRYQTFKYDQVYGGIQVPFGSLTASVRANYSLTLIQLNILPITTPPPTEDFNPTNSEEAIQVALRTLKAAWVPNPNSSAVPVILVDEGIPTLAWQINFGAVHTMTKEDFLNNVALARWEVMVNAETLKPISAQYVARH